MKGFLLAGGLGTRLRPLTDTTPKCLIPIQGTPMLSIWFSLCRAHGITELLVNLHSHADIVREFVETDSQGLNVQLFEEPVLRGSAGTILANRSWIQHEESFWVFYADVLTTANLSSMLAVHRQKNQVATIGVYEVPDPSRCGIVQLDKEGTVREFVEKPKNPAGNLAFSGLMLCKPDLLDVIPSQLPVDLGYHILPLLVGRMAAYRISDYLIDVGTLETYRIAQATWPGLYHQANKLSSRAGFPS